LRDGVVDRFIGEEFLSKVLNEEAVSTKINAALQELIKPKVEAFKANFEKDFQAGMEAGLACKCTTSVLSRIGLADPFYKRVQMQRSCQRPSRTLLYHRNLR
jgi:hypothetical protein